MFQSFNHIFSNIGYVLLGFFFLLIVMVKSVYFPEDIFKKNKDNLLGLPQQYSIFYCMGLTMIFQVAIIKRLVTGYFRAIK